MALAWMEHREDPQRHILIQDEPRPRHWLVEVRFPEGKDMDAPKQAILEAFSKGEV